MMSEPILPGASAEPGRLRRVHPMVLALAQIGCVGALTASPVHAFTTNAPLASEGVAEPVLYLAQATSDYSNMPGKKPPVTYSGPAPRPPAAIAGRVNAGNAGSKDEGGKSGSGTQGDQKR